jgi:hypothetical protein
VDAGVSNDCQQVVNMRLIVYPPDHMSSSIVYASYDETIERFEQVRFDLAGDNDLEGFNAHCNPEKTHSSRSRLAVSLVAQARTERPLRWD